MNNIYHSPSGSTRSSTHGRSFSGRRSSRNSRFSSTNSFSRGHGRDSSNNKSKRKFTWSIADLRYVVESSKRLAAVETVEVYKPQNEIETLAINATLKRNILAKGYRDLTPIQDQSIPSVLAGRDLVGIANTGTGKTAAFLIPLIHKVSIDRSQKVLIIAPTRELADQIDKEFKSLGGGLNIYSCLVIGGKNIGYQISQLRRNPNFVIGTPGRINDLILKNALSLSNFNNVVLDETDRMLDIGFLKEITNFIKLLPKNRQSLFFSATVSSKVSEIISSFVNNAKTVSVAKHVTNSNIQQEVITVDKNTQKVEVLISLLAQTEYVKVLVFGNTKWGVQKLADELSNRGIRADAIHGDKRQNQRHTILDRFRKNDLRVLLATDVASRGLDIKGVSHVINYELPLSYDEYIHRIGRTGRADQKGVAVTLV